MGDFDYGRPTSTEFGLGNSDTGRPSGLSSLWSWLQKNPVKIGGYSGNKSFGVNMGGMGQQQGGVDPAFLAMLKGVLQKDDLKQSNAAQGISVGNNTEGRKQTFTSYNPGSIMGFAPGQYPMR